MYNVFRNRRIDIGEYCNVYYSIMKNNLVIKLRVKWYGFSYLILLISFGYEKRKIGLYGKRVIEKSVFFVG